MNKIILCISLFTSMTSMASNQIVPDFLFAECGAGIIPSSLCQSSGAVMNKLYFPQLPKGTALLAEKIFKTQFDGEFGPTTVEEFPKGTENLAEEMELRGKTGVAIASRLLRIKNTGELQLYTWWEVYRN